PNFVELATNQLLELEEQGFEVPVSETERAQLFEQLSYFDITKHPETLNGRPVFMWHGKKDIVVPFQPTYAFYEAQQSQYAQATEKDRKSTRLNSSHVSISYAVFCLKKK